MGAIAAGPAPRGPDPVAEGRFLYGLYCRSCHGEAARGDGPVADELKTRPADLTRIRSRHDGVFPDEEVYAKIDGRDIVAAHGPGDMPVWGYAFQETGTDVDQEAAVRRRILALVAFLRAIQEAEAP
jgi:hypothetical protein